MRISVSRLGSADPRLRQQSGFTLIELMVVLTVAAVILVFAIPSFEGVINNNRVTTTINELSTTFAIARTEAIKSNSTIRVKATDHASHGWKNGYKVLDSSDNEIKIVGPINSRISKFTDSTSTVVFNSLGGLGSTIYPTSTSTVTFTIHAPKAYGRDLNVTMSGATTVCVHTATTNNSSCP